MKKLLALLIVVSGLQLPVCGQNIYQTLKNGFSNPPQKARPSVYHWWLGGNVDTVRLKQELIGFKNAGISGFTIFEIGSRDTVHVKSGPAYLGDESLATIKFAVEEAGKLGLDVGLNTASSWNAGGTWITPQHAAKSIYVSKIKLDASSRERNKLPFPEIPDKDPWGKKRLIEFGRDGKPVYHEDIAVLAVPVRPEGQPLDTASILNITRYFDPKTERLNWKVPAGEWEVHRYVCANSGENLVLPSKHSAGPIVDHYDAEATEFHFMYIINRLQSVLGDLRKTALKSLYMASYEMKGFTWTRTLPDEFRKVNGYPIYKLLPALFDDKVFSPDVHAVFRVDFQETLSELMINNFYKKSSEVCRRYGLKNNSEAGGPGLPIHNVPVEPIKALGNVDIPRGEFWINHTRFNDDGIDILRVVKEVSAASHIYNRGIVEMEAFTSFQQWREGPFEMKPVGDRAFAEGMNKVVVHGSTHNPEGTGYPGIVYHAGTHYNDKRVWWPKVRPFNEYLSRVSYILQEADFFADVLYYYGDTIPNFGGHKYSRFSAGPGYDYEIVNTEILLEATVKNGKIVLPRNNASFSVLVLADEQRMHPAVLNKLADLVSKGAVVVGKRPARLDAGLTSLRDRIWMDLARREFPGKGGKVYENVDVRSVLGSLGLPPDFTYPGDALYTLDYIHYAKEGLDFYFVRNTKDEWVSATCSFRQKGKVPEIWDPVTGEVAAVAAYQQKDDYVTLPVTLPPYGSTFVVFKSGKGTARYTGIRRQGQVPRFEFTNDGILVWEPGEIELISGNESTSVNNHIGVQDIDGAWEVFFPEGWDAPKRVVFNTLESWTTSPIEGVRYFSGIATYKKTFQYPVNKNAWEDQRVFLDLGDLSYVGEVWLNDQPLGIAWAKPYRFDVTRYVKPGNNTLVVEVANTWNNRLVGDAITGKKFTKTNITNTNVYGLNHMRLSWKDVPLLPSGLFGPVRLYTLKPVH